MLLVILSTLSYAEYLRAQSLNAGACARTRSSIAEAAVESSVRECVMTPRVRGTRGAMSGRQSRPSEEIRRKLSEGRAETPGPAGTTSYLKDVLERLTTHTASQLRELMPHYWQHIG